MIALNVDLEHLILIKQKHKIIPLVIHTNEYILQVRQNYHLNVNSLYSQVQCYKTVKRNEKLKSDISMSTESITVIRARQMEMKRMESKLDNIKLTEKRIP